MFKGHLYLEPLCALFGAFLLSFLFSITISETVPHAVLAPTFFISLSIVIHSSVQIIKKERLKYNILLLFMGIFFAIFMISMLLSTFSTLDLVGKNVTSILGVISFIALAVLVILICDCEDKRK